jgi:TonB family protein
MTRGLAVWAAATALAGCLAAQERPTYVPPELMERQLVYQPSAVYPRLAKEMRISGAVELAVWISADGMVQAIRLIQGHPLLVKAAIDAVRQWRYRPVIWWWERPPDVITRVTVNFSLQSNGTPDQTRGKQTIVHVSE